MQMLFPFCKPFKLWLVRSRAVCQNCSVLYPSATQPCQTGEGWCVDQHHGTGQPLVWRDQPIQIAGSFTGTGINWTLKKPLGVWSDLLLFLISWDLRTQVLRSSHKWLLYTMSICSSLKRPTIASTLVPSSSPPSYLNYWGLSIPTSSDTATFLVVGYDVSMTLKNVYSNKLHRVKRQRFRAVSCQLCSTDLH